MRYILALIVATLLLGASAVLLPSTSIAQVSISLNLNLDRQPIWGPTGYDHVDYYYLPDIDVYYYVPGQRYYYSDNGTWRSGSSLPSRYRGFDLYNSYKVVVNDPQPYKNDATYRDKYASYKGRHDQETIRDSRDPKYFVNPKHPEYKNWVKEQKQNKPDYSNGKGNGNNKNNGNGHGQK